jgi:predicted TIM-barrel fold metal-dependent hydrolase
MLVGFVALGCGCQEGKTPVPAPAPSFAGGNVKTRRFGVIDVHEHLQTAKDAERLIEAMDALGIRRACLQASSKYTFTLSNKYGFEGFEENNEELLRIKKLHPGRFSIFVTLDPEKEGNLERLKDYVARGADGLKLYLGHGGKTGKGPFHSMSIDDERMRPLFAWAEEVQLPITFHVNLILFWDEFLALMERFPYLRANVPHFGLHQSGARRQRRIAWLLSRYPNLYTDISFGWRDFQRSGFESLVNKRERAQAWFKANASKVLYASDMVLEKTKTRDYIFDTLRSYMQLLEEEEFAFFLLEDNGKLAGLALPEETLRTIYEEAPARFLMLAEDGSAPDRVAGWPPPGMPMPGKPPVVPEVAPLNPEDVPP